MRKGHIKSEATKKKMSTARKKYYELHPEFNKGENNPMYGVPMPTELRKKLNKILKIRMKGENNPMYRVSLISPYRGKSMVEYFGKEKFNKIMKKRLQTIEQNGSYKKENNPNWKGGISFEPYNVEFDKELREEIRERDCFECQYCGINENGRRHDVHHINYIKKDSSKRNLITLCLKHNIEANYSREKWQFLFETLQEIRGI